jgi:hypothetical protein
MTSYPSTATRIDATPLLYPSRMQNEQEKSGKLDSNVAEKKF